MNKQGRSARTLFISDLLWKAMTQMAEEMSTDIDALANQAFFTLARLNGYVVAGRLGQLIAPNVSPPDSPIQPSDQIFLAGQKRNSETPPPLPLQSIVEESDIPESSSLASNSYNSPFPLDESPEALPDALPVSPEQVAAAHRIACISRDVDELPPCDPFPEPANKFPHSRSLYPTKNDGSASQVFHPISPPPAIDDVKDVSRKKTILDTGEASLGLTPGMPSYPEYQPTLFIEYGEQTPIKVDSTRFLIGRGPHCNLVIESKQVSREHALLVRGDDGVIIEDLNSLNGTWFNQSRISKRKIEDGDTFTLGSEPIRCSIR
jgi:hypothetical protein